MALRTKEELIEEIKILQKRIARLEKCESERKELDDKVIRRSVELARTTVDLRDEIEERKKMQELQKRLVSILESAPDFIGFADAKDKHIVYINKAGRTMVGIGEDEDVAKLKVSDVHPQWANKIFIDEVFPIVMRDGIWKGESAFLNIRDGHEIPVSMVLSAHRGADKEVDILSTISRDITEGKKAQEALKESERKIRALYDQTFQFIGLMTPDGTLIEANRTALEFSGIGLADVLKKPFWQTPWWAHSPELQEKLRQAIKKVAQGEFFRFEATHMAKDGTLHDVDFSLKPVKDGKGKVIFMIPEGRDITEHKKAEEALKEAYAKLGEIQNQLIQSEKLNAIGQLASGLVHEVKDPLEIMLQGVKYLESRLSVKEADVRKTLGILKDNINRADNIINSLLDFSKVRGVRLKTEALRPLLENSLASAKARHGFENIETTIDVKKDIFKVLADKNKLEQVFVNILLNAAQAMPDGGKIRIRSFNKKLEEIRDGIGRRAQDNFRLGEKALLVEIEDTGTGISEESLKRIFDPFFTTKDRKDAGLGLYVAENIIHSHKGLIYAESKPGQGTKMTVILKVAETQ